MSDSRFEFVGAGRDAPSADAVLDVVFVHGLTGDCFDTWTHGNKEFWPEWLAKDYPSINVYAAGYDSHLTAKISKGSGAELVDVATMILDRLISRKSKSKPLLFITHSYGGLVVKQLLRKSCEASNPGRRRVCDQARGVIFIGTPHQGTQFAASINSIFSIVLSAQVQNLAYAGPPLVDLSEWFRNWAPQIKLPVWSYYEVEKYKGVLVVDQVTANPNVFGCDPVALQANHVEMVKLKDRNSQLYQSVIAAIEDIVGAVKLEGSDDQLEYIHKQELTAYTTHAADDRRTLAEKLKAAGRSNEIMRAERQKERFSMDIQRSIVQPSAVRRHARLLSNIETRFQRHVAPLVAEGKNRAVIDKSVQEAVLDPSLSADDADGDGSGTQSYVESAYYYLAGNCHIGWGENE